MWHEIFYFDTTRVQSAKKPKAIFRDREDFNDYLKGCWEKNKNLTTRNHTIDYTWGKRKGS